MEEIKLSLYADNTILYIENTKDVTQKLLELINSAQQQEIDCISLHKKYHKGNEGKKKNQPLKITSSPPPPTTKIKYFGVNLTKEVKHTLRTIKH